MTSNAKIGFLLGLAIIFVIVFVINGLSGFDDMAVDDPAAIIDRDPPGIRPDITPEVFTLRRVPDVHPEEIPPSNDKELFQVKLPKTTSPNNTNKPTEPVKQVWPKVYIVCKGDNLADIAKKFYGPKEGNRIANVKRIFQANSKSLDSPDEIYPGQKLIIPSLRALVQDENGMDSIFPESMFEKVESVGRRHL